MYNKIDGVYSCLVYTASRITFHGMVEWLRRRGGARVVEVSGLVLR